MQNSKTKNQPTLFDVVKKIEQSTSTIEELRVPIFAPVQKITPSSLTYKDFVTNKRKRQIETSWGKVEIRNNIMTQTHKDLIDCIYTYSQKIINNEDGSVSIFFSKYEILKQYGDESRANQKWLTQKLEEIRDTTVKYVSKDGNYFDFNIISHIQYSEEHNAFMIELDKRYISFYEQGLSINYSKKLPELLNVDSALLKAIIRFFFTHKTSKYGLDSILVTIGYPINSPRALRTAKLEMKKSINILKKFNIDYDSNNQIFTYLGNESIGFIPSLFSTQKNADNNLEQYIGKNFIFENENHIVQSIFEEDKNIVINTQVMTIHLEKKDFESFIKSIKLS